MIFASNLQYVLNSCDTSDGKALYDSVSSGISKAELDVLDVSEDNICGIYSSQALQT